MGGNTVLLIGMFTIFLAIGVIAPGINPAYAGILTTYNNDKATFLSDTSAVDISGVYDTPYWTPNPIVLGDVTIDKSSGGIAVGTDIFKLSFPYPGDDWTSLMDGRDIAIQGPEDLDITINTGTVSCFGFDFVEPTVINIGPGDAFIDSTFDITLKDGASTVGTYSFSPDNDVATFTGVCSDMPFDKVEVRERLDQGSATQHRENEFYGHFHASVGLPPQGCVPDIMPLIAGQNIDAGIVTINNDQTTLTITIETQDGWQLSESHLHIGETLNDFPLTKKGNPKVGNFDYQREYNPLVTEDTYEFELADLVLSPGDTITFAVHAVVVQTDSEVIIAEETAWKQGERFVEKGNWAMYNTYTIQECDGIPSEEIDLTGQYRTQTQGGWGQTANPPGTNQGAYRDACYSNIAPVVIGDSNIGHDVTFTSSSVIEANLPDGGTPAVLSATVVDPASPPGLNNGLAAQTTTLSISVAFDNFAVANELDATCGLEAWTKGTEREAGDATLAELVLQSGGVAACDGSTVQEILNLANQELADGSTSFTPSELSTCADEINKNFVGAENDNGNLVLP